MVLCINPKHETDEIFRTKTFGMENENISGFVKTEAYKLQVCKMGRILVQSHSLHQCDFNIHISVIILSSNNFTVLQLCIGHLSQEFSIHVTKY